jgi:hypothetical protein
MSNSHDDDADRTGSPEDAEPPVYEKPVIRRYDQIDQVRPYGPSEV